MAGCYFGLLNQFPSFVDRYVVISGSPILFTNYMNVNLGALTIQINHLILPLVIFLIVDTVESVNSQSQYVKLIKEEKQKEDQHQQQYKQQQFQVLQHPKEFYQLQHPNSNWGIFGNPPKSFISGYNIEQNESNVILSNNNSRYNNDSSMATIANEQKNYWQLQQNSQEQQYKKKKKLNLQITEQQKGYENVQSRTIKDFQSPCKKNTDCRSIAYFCNNEKHCECNQGYYPSDDNLFCLGTIGKKCLYDNHCINGAYCKGQKICTCKLEFPYISWDKRSCEENGSQAIKVPLLPSLSVLSAFLVFKFLHWAQLYTHLRI